MLPRTCRSAHCPALSARQSGGYLPQDVCPVGGLKSVPARLRGRCGSHAGPLRVPPRPLRVRLEHPEPLIGSTALSARQSGGYLPQDVCPVGGLKSVPARLRGRCGSKGAPTPDRCGPPLQPMPRPGRLSGCHGKTQSYHSLSHVRKTCVAQCRRG